MTEAVPPIQLGDMGRDLAGFTVIGCAWRDSQASGMALDLDMETCRTLPHAMLPCLGVLVARIGTEKRTQPTIQHPHRLLLEELVVPHPDGSSSGVLIGRWLLPEEVAAFNLKTPTRVTWWRRFALAQGADFTAFMEGVIAGISTNPMPGTTANALLRASLELFQNTPMHSRSRVGVLIGVEVEAAMARLSLTVVDGGIGFGGSMRASHGSHITDARALHLVVEKQASARTSSSGGIGLSVVRDLVRRQDGKVTIVTGGVMWDGMRYASLEAPFPGTAVFVDIHWKRPGKDRGGVSE